LESLEVSHLQDRVADKFLNRKRQCMCLALKHYGFKAIHRFALTPSPLSPGERGWGEGEMTIFAIERHFFVCQIAKQVQVSRLVPGLTNFSLNFCNQQVVIQIHFLIHSHLNERYETFQKDQKKEKRLTELGVHLIRFWADEVYNDLDNVLRVIEFTVLELKNEFRL